MQWQLDPERSAITFSARDLGITVQGVFTKFALDADIDSVHPERSRVVATIEAASISTDNNARDQDLCSAAFLDAEQFPEIAFASREVLRVGAHATWIRGELTIRGETRSIVLAADFEEVTSQELNRRELRFSMGIIFDWHDLLNFAPPARWHLTRTAIAIEIRATLIEAAEAPLTP